MNPTKTIDNLVSQSVSQSVGQAVGQSPEFGLHRHKARQVLLRASRREGPWHPDDNGPLPCKTRNSGALAAHGWTNFISCYLPRVLGRAYVIEFCRGEGKLPTHWIVWPVEW